MTASVDPRVFNTRHRLTTDANQEFIVSRPVKTHFGKVGCKEVGCSYYANGWLTVVPTDSAQDNYIRRECGRKFTVSSIADGLTTFKFGAEQKCFTEHLLPLDKREHFGHRTRPGARVRVHERPEDWMEHHDEQIYKIKTLQERG